MVLKVKSVGKKDKRYMIYETEWGKHGLVSNRKFKSKPKAKAYLDFIKEKTGWKSESTRHSLASKGIKTGRKAKK